MKRQQLNDRTRIAVRIVAAYVSRNLVPATGVGDLLGSVYTALGELDGLLAPEPEPEPAPAPMQPTLVQKSITRDHLISFEDGQRYRSLKPHLRVLGLTPDEYRRKWGLPKDYPMASPGYSSMRSEIARKIGLGRRSRPAPTA